MKRIRTGLAVLAVVGTSVVAGCGGDDEATGGNATTRTTEMPTTAAGPMVSFSSPTAGSEQTGTVMATVDLSGVAINADAVGKAPMDGEGHLHFQMDGGKYDFPKYSGANGELAVKLNVDGKYSPSVTPSITYMNLPPGEHTLKVFLADNIHNDTGPMAETTFTVA